MATAVVTSSTCDNPGGPPQVAFVQLTPGSWSPTAIADTVRFSAVAQSGLHRTIPGLPITWSTDPPGIVFVADDGSAVALGAGTAQLRATIDGVTASAPVHVVQAIESVIILSYFGNTMSLGDSLYLYVDARDRNHHSVAGTRFTLQSLNPAVATVTLEGWVKSVSAGTADIVALAGSRADTAPVHVVP
jgi:hypothetical protein